MKLIQCCLLLLSLFISSKFIHAQPVKFEQAFSYDFDGAAEIQYEYVMSSLMGIKNGMAAVGDLNGDDYPDIVISGDHYMEDWSDCGSWEWCVKPYAIRVYLSDGSGGFTGSIPSVFQNYYYNSGIAIGDLKLVDFDNDGDLDIFIGGEEDWEDIYTDTFLYLVNNGNGVFQQYKTGGPNLYHGEMELVDLNGDGKLDLIAAGASGFGVTDGETWIYEGTGDWFQFNDSLRYIKDSLVYFQRATISVADVDANNWSDVFISGYTGEECPKRFENYTCPFEKGSLIIYNTGTELVQTLLNYEAYDASEFADIDNDGDQDLIASGYGRADIFLNDGSGSFTLDDRSELVPVSNSDLTLADFDNDDDLDLIIIGSLTTNLYFNDGSGQFVKDTQNNFIGLNYGTVDYADFDLDGDDDLLFTGVSDSADYNTLQFINIGNGKFNLNGFYRPINYNGTVQAICLATQDIENDGDQDIILMCTDDLSSNFASTKILINDGNSSFTTLPVSNIPGLYESSIASADFNNDLIEDLFVCGYHIPTKKDTCMLFLNNGAGDFRLSEESFIGISNAYIILEDLNNDQYPELIISGRNGNRDRRLNFYWGNSNGHWTLFEPEFPEEFSYWGHGLPIAEDLNNDGISDLVLAGGGNTRSLRNRFVLINDGTGESFTLDKIFAGARGSSEVSGDINGDGLTEIVYYNNTGNPGAITVFGTAEQVPRWTTYYTKFNLIDADFDKDLDLILPGQNYLINEIEGELLGHFKLQSTNQENVEINKTDEIVVEDFDGDFLEDYIEVGSLYGYPRLHVYKNKTLDQLPNLTKVVSCDDYLWEANDSTYTQSGLYSFTSESGTSAHLALTIVDRSLVNNGHALATKQPNASYQWINCDTNQPIVGETSTVFHPTESGNYSVIISYESCQVISDCETILFPLSVTNIQLDPIILYPNPAKENVTIELNIKYGDINITAVDLSGKIVTKWQFHNQRQFVLPLNKLPKGVYALNLLMDGTTNTVRLIKE